MNQRKKDIMKIRIIQAYAVCKAFLDAYRNEENLKSLEEFGDVVDEISAFVDAFDNSFWADTYWLDPNIKGEH